jgi:putative transposase
MARGERGVWQRRFWEHLIRDDGDYGRHVEYCYINPVKHGWVDRVCDGRTRRFTATCGRGFSHTTGRATFRRRVNSANARDAERRNALRLLLRDAAGLLQA